MPTTMTIKGQITIPKKVREALRLAPGDGVEFTIGPADQIVMHKAGKPIAGSKCDRFETARGKAQVKWRTDELMALLRNPSYALWLLPPLAGEATKVRCYGMGRVENQRQRHLKSHHHSHHS